MAAPVRDHVVLDTPTVGMYIHSEHTMTAKVPVHIRTYYIHMRV